MAPAVRLGSQSPKRIFNYVSNTVGCVHSMRRFSQCYWKRPSTWDRVVEIQLSDLFGKWGKLLGREIRRRNRTESDTFRPKARSSAFSRQHPGQSDFEIGRRRFRWTRGLISTADWIRANPDQYRLVITPFNISFGGHRSYEQVGAG